VRHGDDLAFSVRGIEDTPCVVRVACRARPSAVTVAGRPLDDWSFAEGVLRLRFENVIDPVKVAIHQ
jgi:hypothetical protein